MSKRTQKRIKMVLPLRVWGMDAAGKPFSALAHTLDITRSGARLGGISTELKRGEVIGLQYRHNKGRFRVAWIGLPNTPRATQIGLEVVEQGRDFWGLEGPEFQAQDDYNPELMEAIARPARPAARQYEVEGTVEVRNPRGQTSYYAQVTHISQGGAYIQAHTPSGTGSRLQLVIHICNHEVATNAVVRSSTPGKGMSVEFTQPVSVDDAVRLKSLLYGLEAGTVRFEGPAPAPEPVSIGKRLHDITEELRVLEQAVSTSGVDIAVRDEFRDAVSHVRCTAGVVESCFSPTEDEKDSIAKLNTHRIRTAIRLCKAIGSEMRRSGVSQNSYEIRELMHSVEDLFTLMAGLNFTVAEEAPGEHLVPAAPAGVADDNILDIEEIAVAQQLAQFREHNKARKKRKS